MADVSIDAAFANTTVKAPRLVVWHPTDPNIGYYFYIDGDVDFFAIKTTDGGATWGSPIEIDSDTTISAMAFDVWADWWTPGDTGTKIHIVWFELSDDDPQYRALDVSDDSLGTQVTIELETSAVDVMGIYCSITKAVGGNLYVVWELDEVGERGFERSTDGGATWAARTNPQEALGDFAFLYPANLADTQDIWAVYYDLSTTTLTLKTYDDSADSWAESSAIATVADGANLLWQYPFAASVRHSDGHLILTAVTERDTSTSDHRVWDVTNGTTITEKTAITTNIDDHYFPQVFIDQTTDDIYMLYNGSDDGSEVLDPGTASGASHIYYRQSTDGGTTWAAEVQYTESLSTRTQVWAPLMGPRLYAAWRVGLTVLGNEVNSVTFGVSVSVTPGTIALTTATFAPTVAVSDHKSVTPTTLNLSLTTFAPTATVTAHQQVTPTTAALVLATFAPTVTASDHKLVTPTAATLTLTSFAPTVTGGAGLTLTPAPASLTLETFAPTVTALSGLTLVPDAASLTLTTFAPEVTTTANVVITPTTATLTLASFPPTVTGDAITGEIIFGGDDAPRKRGGPRKKSSKEQLEHLLDKVVRHHDEKLLEQAARELVKEGVLRKDQIAFDMEQDDEEAIIALTRF